MNRPRYRDIKTAQLREVAAVLDRQRPLIIAPHVALGFIVLILADYPTPRLIAVFAIAGANLGWQFVRRRIEGARGVDEQRVFAGLMTVTLIHGAWVAVTGGLTGPFVPLLFPIAIAGAVRFGRSRRSLAILGLAFAVLFALALMPASLAGPVLPRPHHAILVVTTTVSALLILYLNVVAFSEAYAVAGETIDEMRQGVLDEAEERARTLDSIGAKVAHELKNPLAAIKGLVQLLAAGAANDRARERFDVVSSEIVRMEVILRDYLTFSRPLTDLKPEPVELGELVDGVLAVLEARAQHAGIALARAGDAATIVGDPRRMKEALLNLVSNALDATPRGGRIEVRITRAAPGAEIEIRDTGRGIAPDALARVGTPFYTTRPDGTGLGVVLARAVVTQHGGKLSYASEVGRGTTVTIRLPSRPPPQEASPLH